MDPVRLIHIAPELPPTVGGVADYTAILSRRLVEIADRTVEPVLVHAGKNGADSITVNFPVVDLSGQCSASLLAETVQELAKEADSRSVVLLEYSGYGYAWSGAPLWLWHGLREACGPGPDCVDLVTIFHELYVRNVKPWEASFWMLPLQYFVADRLARLSSGLTANWDDAARWLARRTERPVSVSPSFSNVGEPDHLPAYSEREPYAVAFGGSGMKAELYEKWGEELSSILQRADVERIVDIGSEVPKQKRSQVQVPIDSKGILPKEEVSRYLRSATLGLLAYPLDCLKKSGIWGSYAAHGLPTLLAAQRKSLNGLTHGQHFLIIGEAEELSDSKYPVVSREMKKWYRDEAQSRRAANRILSILKINDVKHKGKGEKYTE